MAKKIKGDDGKTYVQKKPFYKRVWFWLLVVIVVIGVGSQMGGSSSNSSSKTESTSTSKTVASSSSKKSNVPTEYQNALTKGEQYAKSMNMSKQAIYQQLTSDSGEKFSTQAGQYAVDHLTDIDWNKNALAKAKDYQKQQAMSSDAIREQLTSSAGEQFTTEQANYAIQHLND